MIISHHACHRQDAAEQQFLEIQLNGYGDAYENSSGTINKTSLYMYLNSTYPYIGLRFNVGLSKGVTIHSANIFIRSSANDAVYCSIYAASEDNALLIDATDDYNLSDRTPTTATVLWEDASVGTDIWVQSPDVSSIVQEIVNRDGWASGNWLLFVLAANSGCAFSARTADYSAGYGAVLQLYWS